MLNKKQHTIIQSNNNTETKETQFSMMTEFGETYPDEQLNKDDITNCSGNVKWSAKVGITVRQIDDRRRGMSKNQQRATNVFTCHGIKQLLTATHNTSCTLTIYITTAIM